ncbi:hypothetical protein JCM10207_002484 [Rhodosporidiobolus poonsookiae]
MGDRRAYHAEHSRASYPAVSSATSGAPYSESYPAYDYPPSSAAPAGVPEYHASHHTSHQATPSYPSSHNSRSRSASAENAPTHAHAPVQGDYGQPGSYNSGSVSPTALYHQQPVHIPSLTSSFFTPPTPAPSSTIYRDRYSSHPSGARPSPFEPLSMRASTGSMPVGMVGGVEGWIEQTPVSPVDAYAHEYPTAAATPALTSQPLTRSNTTSSNTGKGKGKASKTAPRKRVPASCLPCRKKKLRCNRALPCSSCLERGDPEGCVWEGDAVPLYKVRDEGDTKDLKAQVDRLQHLLDALTQQTPPLRPSSRDALPVGTKLGFNVRNAVPLRPVDQDDEEDDEPQQVEETSFDLAAQDLCASLSELALNGVLPAQIVGAESFAPGGGSGEAFVDEAKSFLLTITQRLGLSSDLPFTILTPQHTDESPSSTGGHNSPDVQMSRPVSADSSSSRLSSHALGLSAILVNVRPTISHLLEILSAIPEAELTTSYKFYSNFVHWYSSPLNLLDMERQWPAFRAMLNETDPSRREAQVDPLFVATVLAACASGLASMTDSQAKKRGFPADRSSVVEKWVQAAMLALVVGRFMEEPTKEGIRAALVLSSLYIEQFMTTGETISAGMSLLSLAVHGAFTLGLHRDPVQKGKTTHSFAECEDRRRLFWCLFTTCMSITTGTSRTWSQFDLRQIDCKFPLDCYDAELMMDERAAKARVRGRTKGETFEETPMTASVVRAQYSLLVKKITDTAFGIEPCKYSAILELDAELRAFEASFPSCYNLPTDEQGRIRFSVPPSLTEMRCALIQLCLSAEFVRLHRPFLVLAASDEQYQHSREQCVKYAKRMLAINATPGCKLNWAGHNFKVISAAIVLGIELLQSPDEPDSNSIRSMMDAALQQAEGFATVSSVCRKGSGVVRFLLTKVDEEAASAHEPRRAKRARTISYNPDDAKPSRRSLADALTSKAPSPGQEQRSSRRRKPARPPLMHVQSETSVARLSVVAEMAPLEQPMSRRGSRSHSADDAFPTLANLHNGTADTKGHLSGYAMPPTERPIAGLAYRRSRASTPSSTTSVPHTVGALSAYGQQLSSPELVLPVPVAVLPPPHPHMHLQLPPHPHQPDATSFIGHFPDLSLASSGSSASAGLAAGAGPLTSSSFIDERDMQGFFSSPKMHAPQPGEGDLTPRLEDGSAGRRGPSRFNLPLEDGRY